MKKFRGPFGSPPAVIASIAALIEPPNAAVSLSKSPTAEDAVVFWLFAGSMLSLILPIATLPSRSPFRLARSGLPVMPACRRGVPGLF